MKVGSLLLSLAIIGFACFQAVQRGAPWSPVQNQPVAAAEQVAQNADPERIPVTPDLEADQLFREFQAYRHWGTATK